jgi:hypothetical protein
MTHVQKAAIEAIKAAGYVAGAVLLLAAIWSAAYLVLGVAKHLGAFPVAFAQYPEMFTIGSTVFAVCVLVGTALTGIVLMRNKASVTARKLI